MLVDGSTEFQTVYRGKSLLGRAMGERKTHRPVLLLIGAFSRYPAALDWARRQSEQLLGPIALESPLFDFHETAFYERTMGGNIRKQFWAFERLIDPGTLASLKRTTNDWEAQYRGEFSTPEPRPLNLDPGYLTEAKLVLATTKDRDHRLYLDQGIFAEGTLYFQGGKWCPREWTYPDYRRSDYHQFFLLCRQYLRDRYQAGT